MQRSVPKRCEETWAILTLSGPQANLLSLPLTLPYGGARVLLNVRPTLPWGGWGGWVWQNFRVGGCPTPPPPPRVGWDFVGALGLLSQCHFFLSSVAGSV